MDGLPCTNGTLPAEGGVFPIRVPRNGKPSSMRRRCSSSPSSFPDLPGDGCLIPSSCIRLLEEVGVSVGTLSTYPHCAQKWAFSGKAVPQFWQYCMSVLPHQKRKRSAIIEYTKKEL